MKRRLTRRISQLDTYVPNWEELPPLLKSKCKTIRSKAITLVKHEGEQKLSDHGASVFYELTRTLIDVDVYCIETVDGFGRGSVDNLIEGLVLSLDNDVDAVHTSTGISDLSSHNMRRLIDITFALRRKGVLLTASAGNSGLNASTGEEGKSNVLYPAALPQWNAIGSSEDGKVSGFSSTGPEVVFTLDGENEKSIGLSGEIVWSGTSLSAPRGASILIAMNYELDVLPFSITDRQSALMTALAFQAVHPMKDSPDFPKHKMLYVDDEFGCGSLQPLLNRLRGNYDRWRLQCDENLKEEA